ncbi:MAG TPA: GntR family transcriptional regulator [Gaiellaceae bacterium]|nr:GntR family transcriptional regulator [Gaiellaceae bacterium]
MDPESPVPLWHQLFELIAAEIAEGVRPEGSSVESEQDLCELYGVSRITVRRALAELLDHGWLSRPRPRGRLFVRSASIEQETNRLAGFFTADVAARAGLHPSTRVLRTSRRLAGKLAPCLELARDEPVFRIERLHLGGTIPLALQVSYIPVARYSGLLDEDLSGSLLALLEAQGHLFASAEQHLLARSATAREHRLLKLGRQEIVFVIRRTSRDVQRRPIEYLVAAMPAERFEFVSHMSRRGTTAAVELVAAHGDGGAGTAATG